MHMLNTRRERIQALQDVRAAAQELASILVSRHSSTTKMFVLDDRNLPRNWLKGVRLRRFKQPLWLGMNGYIYRQVERTPRMWRRAQLKQRDLAGIRYIHQGLLQRIVELRDAANDTYE